MVDHQGPSTSREMGSRSVSIGAKESRQKKIRIEPSQFGWVLGAQEEVYRLFGWSGLLT